MSAAPFNPVVLREGGGHPMIVFGSREITRGARKGLTEYQAVAAGDTTISIVALTTLRGLTPVTRKGEAYPPRRAASFWLNHDHRPVDQSAKEVLRGMVARKEQQ